MEHKEQLLIDWADGRLSETDRQELYTYYDASSLAELEQLTRRHTLETKPVEGEWSRFEQRVQRRPIAAKWWRATLLATAVLCTVLAWQYFTASDTLTIENTNRQPRMIALPDGVEVHLAPAATLAYSPSAYADERIVELDGHAYFDVSVEGVFVVHTETVDVAVLGTQFDVWPLVVDGVSTTLVQCVEGSVRVSDADANTVVLTAGEQVLGVVVGTKTAIKEQEVAWLSGRLTFDNVSLTTVYDELERYYTVSFVGELENSAFSGTLPTDNIDNVLNILGAVTGHTYRKNGQRIQVAVE